MPKKGTQSVESQLTELKKVAKGKTCLIVLVRGWIPIRLCAFIDANSGRHLECWAFATFWCDRYNDCFEVTRCVWCVSTSIILVWLSHCSDNSYQKHFGQRWIRSGEKNLCIGASLYTSCVWRFCGMVVQTLELLGLQESVELISTVAELDTDSVPPQLLEIAALCGRSALLSFLSRDMDWGLLFFSSFLFCNFLWAIP